MKTIWNKFTGAVGQTLDRTQVLMLANDLALAPAELAGLIDARPDVRGQMEEMAQRFGVSARDIDAERWRAQELATVCANCKRAYSCKRFLEGKPIDFTADACPNAAQYREISSDKGQELAGLRG